MADEKANKDNNSKDITTISPEIQTEINNTDKIKQKLSAKDQAILMVAKENPGKNIRQLGLKLKDMGVVKHENSIYKRLKKSDYLRTDIDEIRKNHSEFMSREIVPEALKVHKRVLKDKNVPDLKKKDWVALAEKSEFKLDAPPLLPRTINIQLFERVQIAMSGMLEKRLAEQDSDTK